MFVFLKVLLHFAYFGVVGLVEFFVFNWMLPISGMGITLVVTGILFILSVLLYFIIFWEWRPSGGFFDALFDIGDIFD